ncbi:kinase phosphorylation protein-domain-containing protein [Xylaria digitata]|nr:kinase phosphorylation protein-domain-containing protein [Xylaria digitata]
MDLVSSIRKTGSRGGVNFNWEDVTTSAHRENYLGHSLKAPVGRWQKGRDLTWYAKADAADSSSNETAEEKAARERREELKKIKEAEEDALARALGLPVAPRNVTGANAVDVSGSRVPPQNGPTAETEEPQLDENRPRAAKHHGNSERRHRPRRRSRSRSRDPDRRGHRHRDHDRDRDRDQNRRRDRSPGGRYETHHPQQADYRDGRRGHHRQRNYSRERETHGPGQLRRSDGSRGHGVDGPERGRARGYHYRPRSRDRRGSTSPRRHRRSSPERD